ncbi:MAG: glutathione synthase [Candidatus Atelocyanobacterium thalassa isolate SIO64986]|uniref:Glutathione synthetase n=1 Tax=Candidatus Atelocyanobacterium thalassa isolate SIO64986 TaxID=1527444 RepID=A0A086CGS6_9CHRO|nr:MAG: glutathione synthase [Candidatus Atelocyanobacterium thalassa isolate SIO64986]
MKLAFIIDPISKLEPNHDSTVAMIEASQDLGHEVWITEINKLSIIKGKAWAKMSQIKVNPTFFREKQKLKNYSWYEISSIELICLDTMNVVFMRKDPPVNIRYLYATYILDMINPMNTLVLNSPRGLREANEKIYALQFHQFMPATIVSKDKEAIHNFVDTYKMAVLKPLGGKAGEGILILDLKDPNLNSIIEISTYQGQEPVMIQQFLPEAKYGDKRIILLNGEPIGAVNRVPTGKEFRGNMAVGGRVEKAKINSQEYDICKTLGEKLRQDGLYFVGIDVIGGYLTEVNVTSPTGIREINNLDQKNLGQEVIEWAVSQ